VQTHLDEDNMRIAMIQTPLWRRAGGERQILKLAIELEKLGHEVEIFTNAVNEESFPELFEKVRINVIPYPLAGKLPKELTPGLAAPKTSETAPEKDARVPGLRKRMSTIIGRQYYTSEVPAMLQLGRKIPKGFDLINNHNFPTEWAALVAKKRLKAPVVWMCNEPPYWFFTPEQRSGLRKVNWPLFELLDKVSVRSIDEIMVLSHVSEGYVKKAYNKPSTIVRTGVDVDLLRKASGKNLRAQYGLENKFVILFVGGSVYAQRSDLVRALAILSKKCDHVRLVLDTSRERAILTRLSNDLGVADKMLLLHSKSDVELAEVYAACDVFVYPASASPWGLVVPEAMAAAKPVIVSKEVGTSEIIQDGVNGILIEKATPGEIAKKVEVLMNDPKLRRTIGENALKYVEDNLSWEKYAEKVETVFQRILSRRKD
jgi:glycosyltransferase involved in cell wall biosynthesis